jgi:hypothetical protein
MNEPETERTIICLSRSSTKIISKTCQKICLANQKQCKTWNICVEKFKALKNQLKSIEA